MLLGSSKTETSTSLPLYQSILFFVVSFGKHSMLYSGKDTSKSTILVLIFYAISAHYLPWISMLREDECAYNLTGIPVGRQVLFGSIYMQSFMSSFFFFDAPLLSLLPAGLVLSGLCFASKGRNWAVPSGKYQPVFTLLAFILYLRPVFLSMLSNLVAQTEVTYTYRYSTL